MLSALIVPAGPAGGLARIRRRVRASACVPTACPFFVCCAGSKCGYLAQAMKDSVENC